MMDQSFSLEKFNTVPIVGILRNMPPEQMVNVARYYLESGLTTLEITMNSIDATKVIASLVKVFGHDLNIGAGTVCSLDELDMALAAGAQFIVTPVVSEAVIKACTAREVPVFVGAYTPTEIYQAWSLGATIVKVFPAGKLGPGYIKEVLAPFDHIKLMPTGGVTSDNFIDFLKAGAKGLGMGTGLFPRSLIENGEWDKFRNYLSDIVKKYNQFQNQNK